MTVTSSRTKGRPFPQPLLDEVPPRQRSRWLEMTRQDEADILADLVKHRQARDGFHVGNICYLMLHFGLITYIGEGDKELIRERFDQVDPHKNPHEKDQDNYVLGPMLVLMNELFGPQRIESEHKEVLNGMVERLRTGGHDLAETRYSLLKLGLPDLPNEGDETVISSALKDSRRRRDGKDIAQYYFYLKALGYTIEVTDDDKRLMEAAMGNLRADHKGEDIAEMLFFARGIWGQKQPEQTPPAPPLRGF